MYADKCSNNVIIMCKKCYLSCVVKELNLEGDKAGSDTYKNT